MRICFSKDRAAQLDLLLRSLDRYAPSDEETWIIWYGSTPSFRSAYHTLFEEQDEVSGSMTRPDEFDRDLRDVLTVDDTVTFFVDDDVLFRPVPDDARDYLEEESILTFSWRLGHAKGYWEWQLLERHHHGYPGSLDGHTFRVDDVVEMLQLVTVEDPLMLETALAAGCEGFADERPLMASWREPVLIGIPVNQVTIRTKRVAGERYLQSAAELNRRFLNGERIDLDALDFTGADDVLHELEYAWR